MASYDVFEINTARKRKRSPISNYRTFIVNSRTQLRAIEFLFLKYGIGINEIITCRKIGEHDI